MESYLIIILSFIVFASIWCFIGLLFCAFLFLFITKFISVLNTELSAPPVKDFLASATLRHWEPNTPSDISCRWKGQFRFVARPGHYVSYTRGGVKSTCDPAGPDWLAFTIDSEHRHERKGIIHLKTSAQQLEIRVSSPLFQLNLHGQVWLDGVELGNIAMTSSSPSLTTSQLTCLYRSVDRTTEAQWSPVFRPKSVVLFHKVLDYNPDYYPLIVNHCTVASIADIWIRNPRENVQKPFPVAVRLTKSELETNEQNILLVMLGLSLYYNSLSIHRYFNDW